LHIHIKFFIKIYKLYENHKNIFILSNNYGTAITLTLNRCRTPYNLQELREYVTGITHHILTFQKDGSSHQTEQDAVRGPQHAKKNSLTTRGPSSLHEELPHNSRPFFTPQRTPTHIEALLHAKKNSHTIRGPSSLQKESQCARGPSSMNNPPTKRLMSQQTQERHITAGEQQHQSSSSSIKLFM